VIVAFDTGRMPVLLQVRLPEPLASPPWHVHSPTREKLGYTMVDPKLVTHDPVPLSPLRSPAKLVRGGANAAVRSVDGSVPNVQVPSAGSKIAGGGGGSAAIATPPN